MEEQLAAVNDLPLQEQADVNQLVGNDLYAADMDHTRRPMPRRT